MTLAPKRHKKTPDRVLNPWGGASRESSVSGVFYFKDNFMIDDSELRRKYVNQKVFNHFGGVPNPKEFEVRINIQAHSVLTSQEIDKIDSLKEDLYKALTPYIQVSGVDIEINF